jgi:hypothetical protein
VYSVCTISQLPCASAVRLLCGQYHRNAPAGTPTERDWYSHHIEMQDASHVLGAVSCRNRMGTHCSGLLPRAFHLPRLLPCKSRGGSDDTRFHHRRFIACCRSFEPHLGKLSSQGSYKYSGVHVSEYMYPTTCIRDERRGRWKGCILEYLPYSQIVHTPTSTAEVPEHGTLHTRPFAIRLISSGQTSFSSAMHNPQSIGWPMRWMAWQLAVLMYPISLRAVTVLSHYCTAECSYIHTCVRHYYQGLPSSFKAKRRSLGLKGNDLPSRSSSIGSRCMFC